MLALLLSVKTLPEEFWATCTTQRTLHGAATSAMPRRSEKEKLEAERELKAVIATHTPKAGWQSCPFLEISWERMVNNAPCKTEDASSTHCHKEWTRHVLSDLGLKNATLGTLPNPPTLLWPPRSFNSKRSSKGLYQGYRSSANTCSMSMLLFLYWHLLSEDKKRGIFTKWIKAISR